ncbi:MAG: DNA-directed RNA polymerase subunit omega [Deltaproteobacteria bacterium]|nr:MAG: DNA-directed RNA polymerase subunit omega [Deltaproteobacteria bacterium]PLX42152.1 MAG: DNA-directed RNA polymerase subunit omega [Deltaproteobacteria bacterium]
MARVTVEDCLELIPNRFALAMVAAQRAKQLLKGAPAMVQTKNKFVVTALREVAEGKITVKERKSIPSL